MSGNRHETYAGWWFGFGITIVLVTLATLPPFLGPEGRSFLYLAFSGACHQIAERSPHWLGATLAVCHRCYGAYLALPLAALVFRFAGRWDRSLNRHAPVLLTLAVLVPGIDWLGGLLSVWANTPLTRILTGAVFGLTAGYFLSRALTQAFYRRTRDSAGAGPTFTATPTSSVAARKKGPGVSAPGGEDGIRLSDEGSNIMAAKNGSDVSTPEEQSRS